MSEFIDSHFAVTTVLYPTVNLIALVLLLLGAVKTPLTGPFAILAAATALFLVPQVLNLVYLLKSTFELTVPSPSVIRVLFPLQACAEYIAFVLDIVGVCFLVFAARKAKIE